jgi:serine/threonine protein phosphatase PrpC
MRFAVYQVSRRGGRERNEDRMGYCYTRDAGLFALADGMGGHPEGDTAAQLSLQTLAALFQRDARPRLDQPLKFLSEACIAAHHQLIRYAGDKGLLDTPRTTVVACLLQGRSAYWAHCGDSRLYLVRGRKLVARTRDHSYSELQEAMSGVVPLQERVNRNVLFTCLGSPGKPVIDSTGPVMMEPGDRVMLCSDGLWGALDDDEIVSVIASRPVSDAVPELVERALRAAGPRSDNVTVLGVEWESDESEDKAGPVSTQSLGDEVFASTIQASLAGEGVSGDELDEAEIERSIREINDAIRRSSERPPAAQGASGGASSPGRPAAAAAPSGPAASAGAGSGPDAAAPSPPGRPRG